MVVWPAALLACALLAAGCISSPSPSSVPAGSSLDDVQAPAWHVGDSWHYHNATSGRWSNATVEAREAKSGFDTYRVRTERNWDNSGGRSSIDWIDAKTLGEVGGAQGGAEAFATSPLYRIFPLEPQAYNSTMSMFGYRFHMHLESRPSPWGEVAVPAGTFRAATVQVNATSDMPGCFGDMKGDAPPGPCVAVTKWTYAPAVGNVLFANELPLVEWHRG